MKNIINNKIRLLLKIVIAIPFLFLTFGCEDVIVVDLNTADPTIVIEAKINDINPTSSVLITKSTDFYNPGVYEKVSGASVLVNDSEGNSFLLNETSDGVYESSAITGKSNVEYSIEVITEDEAYVAISTMPNRIVLDSLTLEKAPSKPSGDEKLGRYFLHLYFQDQLDIEDYCRFKIFINGEALTGFNIYKDKFTDGNYIDARVMLDAGELDIKSGDIITVSLQSIDEAAYSFYLTAKSVSASGSNGGGPGATSAAPANPVTNWSNKALGFFTAYTVSKDSIIFIE